MKNNNNLAIECLGFTIHTQYPLTTWKGYVQLRLAEKFSGLLADSIRKHLADLTFYEAFNRRENLRRNTK